LIISLPPAQPDPKWWGRCTEVTGTDTAAEGGDVPERGGRRCREQQHMVRSACVAVKHGLGDVQRRVTHGTACCVGRTAALPAPHSPAIAGNPLICNEIIPNDTRLSASA